MSEQFPAISRSGRHLASPRRGFALIVSLALMGFIVLLFVSLSTLVQVEVHSFSQTRNRVQAQQNALLGLEVAIGELQATLGPDQRVNTSADMFLPAGSASPRRNWIGVFDSWKETETDRPAPVFKQWLVSGPKTEVIKPDPTTVNLGASSNELINTDALNKVEAGVVNVDGTNSYSWWIGDENAKVRIQAKTEPEENLGYWLNKHGGGAASTINILDGLMHIEADNPRIEDTSALDHLKLIGGDMAVSDGELFHTVSFHSEGLFTNVRRGGLLNDLSFYLETSEADRPTEPLYEYEGLGGINFSELWAYYNLWSHLESGGGAHPDGGTLPSSIPLLRGDDDPSVEENSPFGPYRRPIMIRAGWLFSLKSLAGTAPDNYELVLVADPIVTLWNPYDVSLEVPSGSYMSVRFRCVPYDLNIYINGVFKKRYDLVNNYSLNGTISLRIGNPDNDPLSLRPGEVQIYSRSGDQGKEGDKGGYNTRSFDGSLGWTNDQGGLLLYPGVYGAAEDRIGVSFPVRTIGSQNFAGPQVMQFVELIGSITDSNYWNASPVGGFYMDKAGWGQEYYASELPQVFEEIPMREVARLDSLATSKQHVAFFSLGMRTEVGADFPSRFLTRASRAAGYYDVQDFSEANMLSVGTEFEAHAIDSNFSNPGFDVLNGSGFFGGGYDAATGQTRLITQSIPRVPIHSLGSFQHASASGLEHISNVENKLEPVVAYAIGNSHALPVLPPDETTGTTNSGKPAVDHSFLANQALWDDWYFSSIAPQTASIYTTAKTQREVLDDFISGTLELPNARIRFAGEKEDGEMVSDLFPDDALSADAYRLSAKYLLNEGAFNVNTTNVDAWAAHLSSLREESVPVVDPETGNMSWKDSTGSPIPGLSLPASQVVMDSDLTDTSTPGQWLGYRELDDTQVRQLAEAIVNEIRQRGPFLSMADFVNRRVGSDKALASKGALQAALDSTVNTPVIAAPSRSIAADDIPSGFEFPEAEVGARATGMPGFVDQADLLTVIGPGLTVRSDTFKIRAQGNVTDLSGKVISTARCEAVIQRGYDYLDSNADSSETRADELTSAQNGDFGRRFTIVSFRWLNDDEI